MKTIANISKVKRARRMLARALVCVLVLILPSCAIPKLRLPDAQPPLPDTFNGATSAENSSKLGIDEFFNDPMLTSLIEQALGGNRELKILNEEVQVARAEIFGRTGAYIPFVTYNGSIGLEKSSRYTRNGAVDSQLDILPGQPFPNPLPNYAGGLGVFWQPDIWRQYRNARDAAVQRYYAAIERRYYFTTRLVAETAENYYKLMALDRRMETLIQTIELQEQSMKVAQSKLDAGRGTELAVQRFKAEVRKNQSEKLIVTQDIIEVENRINFLVNRFPQPVERMSSTFFDVKIQTLCVGVPSQLLQNRADIRQAEHEIAAAGLDVKVARAKFFPNVVISGNVGYEAFNPRYLFNPEAFAANVAGGLVGPLINKAAIKAEYRQANAKQLEAVYNYQRVVLNAFIEVVNRVAMVENYTRSIDIKKQQLEALSASVKSASSLFQSARVEYVDVLLAQRDLMEARMVLIETKKQQLGAIVNAYQALGGGIPATLSTPPEPEPQFGTWTHPFRGLWSTLHDGT